MMHKEKLTMIMVVLVLFFAACSTFNSEKQYTNKVVAPDFITELYGHTDQTIAVNHPDGAHISWMGFIQSNDYKYFQITKVQVGTQTIVAENMEIDGELFTPSCNAIVEDITVGASASQTTGYANGNISVAGANDLKITVRYSPLIAIESGDAPHETYLIINYDQPEAGSMRIKLQGFTQGVKADKCTQAVSTMEVIEYQIKGGAFDLYFCSSEVAKAGLNNTEQDPGSPDYHGVSTNLATVSVTNPAMTFYKVDEETVCILTAPTPTVEKFDLPIPPMPGVPIDSMEIKLMEGSIAQCDLDADGNILCPESINIEALVSLSGFSLTNQQVTAEALVTTDCTDFGSISGSGAFGDESLTLILSGKTLSDQNTQEYNIVDSLIVAVIKLE
ncbi:MAG: hypothetical protein HQM16_02105 [Deltaproteobacteria bacterium]|nr:hypothetical protein [Deltaproteobacteria bacterium]